MAFVSIQNWTFIVKAFSFGFGVFVLFSLAQRKGSIEVGSFFFVNGLQGESISLTLAKVMILILLHYIMNYYDNKV